jgi:hypothetical protein
MKRKKRMYLSKRTRQTTMKLRERFVKLLTGKKRYSVRRWERADNTADASNLITMGTR